MDKLNFNKEDHTYTLTKENGEVFDLISVTTLLKKHGITPDYSNVNKNVLKAKAERGTIIHEELDKYIKTGEIGFTGELEAFIDKCVKENIIPLKSEFMVNNDEIAGTVDVAGLIGGESFIGDFKTTATLHKEAVAWQLSLYAYLIEKQFNKYLCFHFPNDSTCKVVEVDPIPVEEIERLLECERNCELYKKQSFEIDTMTCESLVRVQNELKKLDEQKKQLEKAEIDIKEFLINKFEESGIDLIENEFFRIKYTAPTTRETIDTKRLKEEMPEIASKYSNISPVKAKVTITLRKVE